MRRVLRAFERPDTFLLAGAVVALAFLFYRQTMIASRVIDGVRYFWLDDDMMISMRYGRNLAQGHGLVWTPGERVEGYSNFLWTLIMAVVHLTGVGAQHAALPVRGIGFVLTVATLVLSVRLLRIFEGH